MLPNSSGPALPAAAPAAVAAASVAPVAQATADAVNASTKIITDQQNEQAKALETISKQIEGGTIYGIPEKKVMLIGAAFAFILILIILLVK